MTKAEKKTLKLWVERSLSIREHRNDEKTN